MRNPPATPASCAFLTLAVATTLLAGDPAYYQKKSTWHETLIASREALAAEQGDKAKGLPLPDFGKDPFTITAWVKTSKDGTILAKAPAQGKWAPQGSPAELSLSQGDIGKPIWIRARWISTRGEPGPWSLAQNTVIA